MLTLTAQAPSPDDPPNLLTRLRRAMGLAGLAASTMASGPCASCPPTDECATIDELEIARERGLQRAEETDDGTGGSVTSCGSGGVTNTSGGATSAAAGSAGASTAGQGGVAAVGGHPSATGGYCIGSPSPATGGTPSQERLEETVETAKSWDPSTGCPTLEQFRAIASLDGHSSWADSVSRTGDKCCYTTHHSCDGRPFLVAGRARVAALRTADDVAIGQGTLHRSLADAWLSDALAEHASIAAFARLSLQLMALGAPIELVRESQLASLDEARHAEVCFRQAARYGAHAEPGALDVRSALDDTSFETLSFLNVLEGCVGETLASARVFAQARKAESPELRDALTSIAFDEERHAVLAWRILRWGLSRSPERARRATRAAIESFLAAQSSCAEPTPAEPWELEPEWTAGGRLAAGEGERLDRATLRDVVLPLIAELLDATPRGGEAHATTTATTA